MGIPRFAWLAPVAIVGCLSLAGCAEEPCSWNGDASAHAEQSVPRARLEVEFDGEEKLYRAELRKARIESPSECSELDCVEESASKWLQATFAGAKTSGDTDVHPRSSAQSQLNSVRSELEPRVIDAIAFGKQRAIVHVTDDFGEKGLYLVPAGSFNRQGEARRSESPEATSARLVGVGISEISTILPACAAQPDFDDAETVLSTDNGAPKSSDCKPCLIAGQEDDRPLMLVFACPSDETSESGAHFELHPFPLTKANAPRSRSAQRSGPSGNQDPNNDPEAIPQPKIVPLVSLGEKCEKNWRSLNATDEWMVFGCTNADETLSMIYGLRIKDLSPESFGDDASPDNLTILEIADLHSKSVTEVLFLPSAVEGVSAYAIVQTSEPSKSKGKHREFRFYSLPSDESGHIKETFDSPILGSIVRTQLRGLAPYIAQEDRLIYLDRENAVRVMNPVSAAAADRFPESGGYSCLLNESSNKRVEQIGWTASHWAFIDFLDTPVRDKPDYRAEKKHELRYFDRNSVQYDGIAFGEIEVIAPVSIKKVGENKVRPWVIYRAEQGRGMSFGDNSNDD